MIARTLLPIRLCEELGICELKDQCFLYKWCTMVIEINQSTSETQQFFMSII